MVKDNEKRYVITKTYKVRFQYEEHGNVKKMRPFVKEIVKQIKSHADNFKLSHYQGFKEEDSHNF